MFNGMTQTSDDLSLILTLWISWNQLMGCSTSSVPDSYSAWVEYTYAINVEHFIQQRKSVYSVEGKMYCDREAQEPASKKGGKRNLIKEKSPDHRIGSPRNPFILESWSFSTGHSLPTSSSSPKSSKPCWSWLDFILALNLFRQHNRNIDHLQGIGRQWDPGNQCRVWTIKQILHDTTLS